MVSNNCYKLLRRALPAILTLGSLAAQTSSILTVAPPAKVVVKRGGTADANRLVSVEHAASR